MNGPEARETAHSLSLSMVELLQDLYNIPMSWFGEPTLYIYPPMPVFSPISPFPLLSW
jgi:hypothetical protein